MLFRLDYGNSFILGIKWVMDAKLIPSSTYRLQFSSNFTFKDAEYIIPYLVELGISHVYSSPIFTAVRGSQHCYDVTNPFEINPDLGGEKAFRLLREKLRNAGIGWIQDFVPNHMAFSQENEMLKDVLLNGVHSKYGNLFDIDWENALFEGKIVCPILSDDLEKELSEIKFSMEGKRMTLEYMGNRLPVPENLSLQFSGNDDASGRKIVHLNSSSDQKFSLISKLPYVLRNWKTTNHEINYRRFFNVNGLIAINSSDLGNIHYISARLYDLIEEGLIDGIRLDHIDGIHDPQAYLVDLRKRFPDLIILVEKILSNRERLSPNWPVEGTTGYDFLFLANSIQSSRTGSSGMDSVYISKVESARNARDIIRESKCMIADTILLGDLKNLAHTIYRDIKGRVYGHDVTLHDLRICLREYLISLDVYRTYIREGKQSDSERNVIKKAISDARGNLPGQLATMDILEKYFTDFQEIRTGDPRMKLQQYEPAFFAKSIEDRFFYVHNPLISRNEVGCDPYIDYMELPEFHEQMAIRSTSLPHTMNLTSTHDTKFGEDLRAKINALQDIPDEWSSRVSLWKKINSRHLRAYDGVRCPVENQEYLVYQVLAGSETGSFRDSNYKERLYSYLMKIIREGGRTTGWFEPNLEYEENFHSFLSSILDEHNNTRFTDDLLAFQKRMSVPGAINSLGQVILKLTSPGFPDIYRGCEALNFSFVDPDNRRAVNHGALWETLKRLPEKPGKDQISDLIRGFENGVLKMYVTAKLLNLRKNLRALFETGSYDPIYAHGSGAESMLIFSRTMDNMDCIVFIRLHVSEFFKVSSDIEPDYWNEAYADFSGHMGDYVSVLTSGKVRIGGGREYLRKVTSGLPFEVLISSGE